MKLFLLAIFLLYFLIKTNPAYAVSVIISNTPSSITDQPFSFNVSVSGAQAGTNYLRVDLFQTNTQNYFGYTYNSQSFVNSSAAYNQFLPITIVSSQTWNGTIQAKLDPQDPAFVGAGNYSLKVRRYTSATNYTWSNEVTLTINYTNPTPSPSPSPSSSSASSSFTISSVPAQIDSTQTITPNINLNLPNSPSTNFYLKGVFKKSDSSNYFGLTKVNGSFIKNSDDSKSQVLISTDLQGKYSGTIEVGVDPLDPGYSGSGDYIFKVGRYDNNGNNLNWSNETTVTVNAKEILGSGASPVNLSGLSSKSKNFPSLPVPQKLADLPEAVYSLENYRKLSTVSGAATQSSTPAVPANLKAEKQNNIWPLFWGGLFLITAAGLVVYKYFYTRLKSAQ